MMDRPRILVCTSPGFPDEEVEAIRRVAGNLAEVVAVNGDVKTIEAALPGASAIIACPRNLFSDRVLSIAGNKLQWIHVASAGCEEFITPGLRMSSITMTNGRIIQGPEVADHAVALLLAVARNLHSALRGRPARPPRPIELRGKVAVVIGVGGIGLLIAERLHAFGMRIIGVNPQPVAMLAFIDRVVPPDNLHSVLPEADAVLMAAPHTDLTTRMIGSREFELMKPTSIFVNVSRGKTVDTDALLAALRAGRPKSAAIDVVDPEPLPENHPLREMENVIITGHQAGLSDHNRARSFELMRTNVERFLAGLQLFNVVDKQLGY